MIASKIFLTPKDLKQLNIQDSYGIHTFIYSMFPGKNRDFLYADLGGSERHKILLVISQRVPIIPAFGEVKSKKIPNEMFNSTYYGFQVKMNPVKTMNNSRKRIPIVDKSELSQWIISKSKIWGFEVLPEKLEILEIGVQQFERKGERITHNSVVFRGVLKVQDAVLFKKSFLTGIGKGKAFGFGLLQLQPIES